MPFIDTVASAILKGSGFIVALTGSRGSSRISRLVSPYLKDGIDSIKTEDGVFMFGARDVYWNRLLMIGFSYEPEIRNILHAIRKVDYSFIDGGANFGYWSVLVSGPKLGSKKVLAIEASAETFAMLKRNQEANGERFQILQRAIWSRSDDQLTFRSGAHAGRGIGAGDEVVTTISLDDCVRSFAPAGNIVVKLDVEGAEVEVISASQALATANALLVYEDHGKDGTHEVTRTLRELGYATAFLARDKVIPLGDVAELDRLKTHRAVGYNLIAYTKGGYWERTLLECGLIAQITRPDSSIEEPSEDQQLERIS